MSPKNTAAPLPLQGGESAEQFEVMLSGKPYLAADPYLCRMREAIQDKLWVINQERNTDKRMMLFDDFVTFGGGRDQTFVMTPFLCEYVSHRRSPTDFRVSTSVSAATSTSDPAVHLLT
jgi:hypothetical protein